MHKKLIASLMLVFLFLSFSIYSPGVFCEDTPDPENAPVPLGTGKKITLDIKGMDVVDVLKMLSTRSGMNIVVGKNVSGRITLFLKEVDIADAFEIVLAANDLAYERKGDIINVMTQRDYELQYGERYSDRKEARVIPLKYAKAADLSRALSQIKTNIGRVVVDEGSNTVVLIDIPQKIEEMAEFIKKADLPVQTRVFSLNYAQVDKLQPKLQEVVTKGVGSLRVDERTNKIIVTDFPAKLDEIDKILAAFDEKTPQVLIDAQIIEVNPSDKFEMGVDWAYWIEKYFKISTNLPIGTTNRLVFGTTNTNPTHPGGYKAVVDILQTIGDTKILSSPRIMALNNQEARILVGTKDAYITSTTSQSPGSTTVTSQSVNFVDVGIKLYVTPTINREGFVTMKIKPEISSAETKKILAQDLETEIPIVSTSEAETTVTVKNGVTIIIGGLRKDQKIKTVKKIPLLGDIPWAGALFRSTSNDVKQTDLVILLTPHIISGETSLTEFSEIKPRDGVVSRYEKGEIVTEKIVAPPQDKWVAGDNKEYYKIVTDKVRNLAAVNRPEGEKGRVTIGFIISRYGDVLSEPQILETSNHTLDDFAVKTVKAAAPFPVFPGSMDVDKAGFRLSLDYR